MHSSMIKTWKIIYFLIITHYYKNPKAPIKGQYKLALHSHCLKHARAYIWVTLDFFFFSLYFLVKYFLWSLQGTGDEKPIIKPWLRKLGHNIVERVVSALWNEKIRREVPALPLQEVELVAWEMGPSFKWKCCLGRNPKVPLGSKVACISIKQKRQGRVLLSGTQRINKSCGFLSLFFWLRAHGNFQKY